MNSGSLCLRILGSRALAELTNFFSWPSCLPTYCTPSILAMAPAPNIFDLSILVLLEVLPENLEPTDSASWILVDQMEFVPSA